MAGTGNAAHGLCQQYGEQPIHDNGHFDLLKQSKFGDRKHSNLEDQRVYSGKYFPLLWRNWQCREWPRWLDDYATAGLGDHSAALPDL